MNKLDYDKIEKIINYNFSNKKFLDQIFVHKSYSISSDSNYERLEFLGDRVLSLILAKKIYEIYPQDSEGKLDKRLASLINFKTCAKVIKNLNLKNFVKISSAQKKIRTGETKILGDLCESLIGAIYLDSNFKESEKFVLKLWKNELINSKSIKIDSKTQLQEYCLKKFKELPKYNDLFKKGPAHSPIFTVAVSIPYSKEFIAEGTSKQEAQQQAAQLLLKELNSD